MLCSQHIFWPQYNTDEKLQKIRFFTEGDFCISSAPGEPKAISYQQHIMKRILTILTALTLTPLATLSAAESALAPVTSLPIADLKLGGALGQRQQATVAYLLWRYRDADRLLFPFEHREQWQRVRDWDGEYIGKWLDASAFMADATHDEALLAAVDDVAKRLRGTQEPDGYLGTEMAENRLKPSWPLWMHWLAVKGLREHGQRRGDGESLKAALRGVDWVLKQYSPIADDRSLFYRGNGHLSFLDELVAAHTITGDRKYLDFGAAAIAHYPPFKAMREDGVVVPTHAYNLMTFLGGAVRLYQARGEREELRWVERIWDYIATQRLFPTASVSTNESFKDPPRDVPSGHLQETCATVEWLMFTHRLYLATGDIRYAHMLERTAHNALLGAQSTDGMKWNYFTPLRDAKDWFGGPTDCCYFSGPRGIARLPELLYHLDAEGVRVDLFESSEARLKVKNVPVTLTQTTRYPEEGAVKITIAVEQPLSFTLKVRIPEHMTKPSVSIGTEPAMPVEAGRYAELRREWRTGDVVSVSFEPETWLATLADGSTAILRGAEVLALDTRDNAVDLGAVCIPPGVPNLERAEPSSDRDHRARYRCELEIGGKPTAVLLTPFSVAGNPTPGFTVGAARYRTAFPPSTLKK